VIFFISIIHLFASVNEELVNIYENIFSDLFVGQSKINVYVGDKHYQDILYGSEKINIVSDINKASICIASTKQEIEFILKKKKDIAIFCTTQKFIYDYDEIIGAFYWTKGRQQLLFIRSRMDKYYMHLPKDYDNFIIDEL